MPGASNTGNPKTGRYYVHIPAASVTEIEGYIKESGMYQTHFLSNALVVGARQTVGPSQGFPVPHEVTGEYQRLVTQALERLAPEQRQVLDLAFFNGLTQVQIAAKLRQPLDAVSTRTKTALRNLAAILSWYGLLT